MSATRRQRRASISRLAKKNVKLPLATSVEKDAMNPIMQSNELRSSPTRASSTKVGRVSGAKLSRQEKRIAEMEREQMAKTLERAEWSSKKMNSAKKRLLRGKGKGRRKVKHQAEGAKAKKNVKITTSKSSPNHLEKEVQESKKNELNARSCSNYSEHMQDDTSVAVAVVASKHIEDTMGANVAVKPEAIMTTSEKGYTVSPLALSRKREHGTQPESAAPTEIATSAPSNGKDTISTNSGQELVCGVPMVNEREPSSNEQLDAEDSIVEYYCYEHQDLSGPFHQSEVRRRRSIGSIKASTQIWKDDGGGPGWQILDDLPDFAEVDDDCRDEEVNKLAEETFSNILATAGAAGAKFATKALVKSVLKDSVLEFSSQSSIRRVLAMLSQHARKNLVKQTFERLSRRMSHS